MKPMRWKIWLAGLIVLGFFVIIEAGFIWFVAIPIIRHDLGLIPPCTVK